MMESGKRDESRRMRYLWFDIDDTLWDMSGNSTAVLSELFYSDPAVHGFFRERGLQEWLDCYHSVNVDLWDSYNRGAIGRDYLRSERFARPLRMCGCGEEEAAAASARLDADYLDRLGRCTGLVAGADELLSALSGLGYRMGLLSNGFKEVQHRKLCSGGIASYFDTLVLSDDIGINKPDPRIFGYALECAGVSAAESVLIGDNPLTDVAGALGAGWSAVWFNPSGESASGVDFATERFLGCARTLDEVVRIICKTEEINPKKTI